MGQPVPPLFRLRPGISLLLASSSPRRQQLLASLGVPFETRPTNREESAPIPGEHAPAYARRMAILKSPPPKSPDDLLISADTVVSVAGQILGKPTDVGECMRMLHLLNGRPHEVCTAVCIRGQESTVFHQITQVRMGQWPPTVLARYAASGEGLDKAGGYAIQGLGAFLIEDITGSPTNVIGLPLEQLCQQLFQLGVFI